MHTFLTLAHICPTCTHVYMRTVHTHLYAHISDTYTHVHAHIYVHTCLTHAHTCTYTHLHAHVSYTCTPHMYVHTFTCTRFSHMHTCACTHVWHTHTLVSHAHMSSTYVRPSSVYSVQPTLLYYSSFALLYTTAPLPMTLLIEELYCTTNTLYYTAPFALLYTAAPFALLYTTAPLLFCILQLLCLWLYNRASLLYMKVSAEIATCLKSTKSRISVSRCIAVQIQIQILF